MPALPTASPASTTDDPPFTRFGRSLQRTSGAWALADSPFRSRAEDTLVPGLTLYRLPQNESGSPRALDGVHFWNSRGSYDHERYGELLRFLLLRRRVWAREVPSAFGAPMGRVVLVRRRSEGQFEVAPLSRNPEWIRSAGEEAAASDVALLLADPAPDHR